MGLTLRSGAFKPDAAMPERYTCEGANISPPLEWFDVPAEAQSLVLICDDPDADNGPWCHWVLYDLSPDLDSLPEDVPLGPSLDQGGLQGRNDYGNAQYDGPCPPIGSTHRYYFRLYALDEPLNLMPGATRPQVIDRMESHVLAQTALIGRYGRQPKI